MKKKSGWLNRTRKKSFNPVQSALPLGLWVRGAMVATVVLVLTACAGTTPKLGGSSAVATGSASGAATANASSQLERCSESLGTLSVEEDQGASWYAYYTQNYKLGSTVPLLRLIIQQSNCFVVVERGSSYNSMMRERDLRDSGEMRTGSRMQKGQVVAADYTMKPSITFSEKGTSGLGGAVGGLLGGRIGSFVGGSLKKNEAATTLLLIDNRSGVQLAAAEGSASNMDFGLLGGLFGSRGGGVASGYTKTPEGKVLAAAFVDSYNNMVRATRNYQAQEVKGGLGTGGQLGVQGGQTPASK